MKKSRYGKLSIILILVATLFISAAIAIFGLAKTDSTGANNSSAVISADEKGASSAIAGGESDDGTISAPEVEAKATGTTTGISSWSTAIASNNPNVITIDTSERTNATTYTVPSGKYVVIQINSGKTLEMASGAKFVVQNGGTLVIAGSGTLTRVPTVSQVVTHSMIENSGTLEISGSVTLSWISGPYWSAGTGMEWGGCVRNWGTFEMKGGTITRCKSANGGGAVCNQGTFIMSGGTISDCSTGGNGGGAVYSNAPFTMTGGTISGNSATGGGGGVCVAVDTFTMTGGTISGNTTTGSGGGVYVGTDGTFEMKGASSSQAIISGNSTTGVHYTNSGGGGVCSAGTFKMTTGYSYIRSNTTTSRGAGVAILGGSFTMSNGTIGGSSSYANTTANCGGGLYVYSGTAALSYGAIIACNRAGYGGGLYTAGGSVTLSGSSGPFTYISENSATYHGGGINVDGGTLTMSNIVFIFGNTAGSNGGGIYAAAGTVNIISSNARIGTNPGGYASANTAAGYGGGVCVGGGTVNMSAGSIANNKATGTSSDGGGVYVGSGTFKMTGGDIYRNTAYRNGGGIRVNGGTCTISGTSSLASEIDYNTATSGDGYGGGISVNAATSFSIGAYTKIYSNTGKYGGGVHTNVSLTINQSTTQIYSNTANYGGGIYTNNSVVTLTLSSGTIGGSDKGNTANNNGGGVYVGASKVVLSGGNVTDNRAKDSGGGVYIAYASTNAGACTMTSGTISGNTAKNDADTSGNGGGVYIATGRVFNMSSAQIAGNTAVYGGGVYVGGGTFAMSSNATVHNNTAKNTANTAGNGGCVYVNGGSFTMNVTGPVIGGMPGNIFSGNAVNGGGVYVNGGTFTHTAGRICGNSASNGGGVYYNGGTFTLNGGSIGGYSGAPNNATSCGGGVYLNTSWTPTSGTIAYNTSAKGGGVYGGNGTFTLNNTNVNIYSNTASGGYGGGVCVGSSSSATYGTFAMSAGTIRNNSAVHGGGVAVLDYGRLNMTGGTVGGSTSYKNTASAYGGGIFIQTSTPAATFTNALAGTVSYNNADLGGGVCLYAGAVSVTGSICNNAATTSGGGVYLHNGTVNHSSGSIYSNTAVNGGGVYTDGGTYNHSGSAYVRSNTAQDSAGTKTSGGGVHVNGGTYNLTGGYIGGTATASYGNAAAYGGGVQVAAGTFNQSGGYVGMNTASSSGGGVYVAGGTYNLSGGYVRGNTASNGGGVYRSSGTFTMTGGTIGGSSSYKNTATNGGGLYVTGSPALNLEGGTISYNTATNGGGVYQDPIMNTYATLAGVTISYNTATYGGGYYLVGASGGTGVPGASLTMTAGYIRNNTATEKGGGVYITGQKGVFILNGGYVGGTGTSYANTAVNGGGVYNDGGIFNMSAGTVAYNTATYGAGVYQSSGTATLSGTAVISNNTASSSGGGASVYGGTFNIDGADVEIKNNTCNVTTAGYGGGLYQTGTSTVNLKSGKIHSNDATYAGGVFVHGGTFNITGGTIGGEGTGNTAIRNGGGIYINPNGTVIMSGGEISYNSANNADSAVTNCGVGGGISVNSGKLTVTGGTILHNTAVTNGGGIGIYSNNSIVNLQGGEISENIATQKGGGIAHFAGTVNLTGTTISNNTAVNGGGVHVGGGTANMSAGSITANTSTAKGESSGGAGVYIVGGTFNMTGGQVTANVAEKSAYGAGVHVADGGTLQLGNTAYIYGNTYHDVENNVFVESEQSITFSGALASDAKIGIIGISTDDFVLTDGFTAAGHTQSDIATYFTSDIRGLTLKYLNNEIVIRYDIVLAWNETIQASLDNNSTETFIMYYDWLPEDNAFGDSAGVGFYGTGLIYVPEHASVIFDFNDKNVDRDGTSGSSMRVEGTLVLETLNGGFITGGNAENGGAIYVYGGSLTFKSGTICDNTASYGGAIYVDGNGEFTQEGGTIVRNTAENGGAVYLKDGNVTLAGGTIGGSTEDKNSATSYGGAVYVAGGGYLTVDGGKITYNEALSGGAIYVDGGRLDIAQSSIEYNKATENGGGVYVDSGNVTLNTGSFNTGTIRFNVATENGGGIYVAGGNVTIDDIYIGINEARNGAGLYIAGGNVLMDGGKIYSNKATENGGGVYVTGTASQFTFTGGEIGGQTGQNSNKAQNGIGIYINSGTVTVTDDGLIANNSPVYGQAANGAGIYLANGTLNVTGGVITDNNATYGGGVYMAGGDFRLSGGEIGSWFSGNTAENGAGVYMAGGVLTISDNGEIWFNVATENGAGVYVADGTLNMSGGYIDNNGVNGYGETTTKNGAGVYVAKGTFSLSGGEILANEATENGGGVYITGADTNLNITGGKIRSNTASFGGGVYVDNGTVNMTGGAISDNAASLGGGGVDIANDGIFNISGTAEISGNNASSGGGVYNYGKFTMDGGKISANKATSLGGGIVIWDGGSLEMNDGEISGNTATNSGGGVYNDGEFTLNDGTVSGNKAQNGAGVYVNTDKTLNMLGGVISGNIATGATTTYGGGVYVNTNAEVNVSETAEISGNSAVFGGGVYVNEGALNVTNGTISENSASSGGGVYVMGGSAELSGGKVTKNTATDANVGFGGGGVFINSGSLVISGTAKINENSAARYGGGIRVDGSTDTATVEMTAGAVSENTATIGGGVYVAGDFASVTLATSAMISENTATTSGGGVAVADGASLEVEGNAYVTKNKATLNGGGVFVTGNGSTATVSDHGAITYNTAQYGGGLYVTSNSALTIDNGSLSFNKATANGGAAYINGATITIENGEVLGNAATANGGAVYVAAGATSSFKMNGGVIGGKEIDGDGKNVSANVAKLGGGLYIAGGNVTLTSGEIKNNEATENGGGVYFNAGTLSAKGNPVIKDNTFQDSASNLYLYNGKTVNVTGELTEGAYIGVTGTGQVTVGYTANGNGDDQKDYFVGDVAGSVVVINVGEIFLQISLEDAWNAAVQASLDKGGSAVTFVLAETWRATNGEFGASTGVGFTDTGALKVPTGAYIILNLNVCTINRNMGTATAEGSVFYIEGKLEISGTTGYITGGASTNGGAITVKDGGYVKLAVGYIQNNNATENGGGVYVASGAKFEMTGGAIRGNSAKNGGAVYVENGGTFNMTDGTMGGTGYANTATENGGAIYSAGTTKVTKGTITLNVAENGGALYVADGESTLSGGTIKANSADNGAGVYVADGEFTLDGATITAHEAGVDGAGLYVAGGTATIESGSINGNTGSAVYVVSGTHTMNGGKITNNTASGGSAAIIEQTGTFIMNGGEIIGNECTGSYSSGTIAVQGAFTMNDGLISNNTVANIGGAVAISDGGMFTMNGGEIIGNSAKSGGAIYLNNYVGLTDETQTAKFNMFGGKISGNEASSNGGAVHVDPYTTFTMSGGEITGNKTEGGAGIYNAGTTTLTGGKITNNVASGNAGGVYNEKTLNISGTVEISNNSASVGGGVRTYGASATMTMDGGSIYGNTATRMFGGGVFVQGGTFEMNGGEITDNGATTSGGGVYVYENAHFTMNGGKIANNRSGGLANYGGGVCVENSTFEMNGGEISGNVANNGAGVYLGNGGGLILTGGKITENEARVSGGGVYVGTSATIEMEGSPMVYGNTAAGEENNIYLVANKTIAITGMLSTQGLIAYVGVAMADPSKRRFTTNFATNNSDYNPDLRPETVFFSDNTDYMVSLEDNEAVLVENDYSQTSLVWQLSKDGKNTWISIDAPYFSLRYKSGETYAVRALDSTGNEVEFTWATDADGDIDASSFSGIGSYKFVINDESYLNPSLTFEILPATLYWQYSTDEGRTWRDLTVDTMEYTSATYQIRACVYESDYVVIQSFASTMKDVGDYEYTVDNAGFYENPTLNFKITTRYITVDWNFGNALGNETDGYYWEYDGKIHAPVVILSGVSDELAGVTLNYAYDWSGGLSSSGAMAYAGTYTLTVTFKTPDPNVVISGNTVTYKINGVTLSLEWIDENGNTGDEFEFEYDSEAHGVDFILNGVITGDNVGAYVTYATRSGKVLSGAPTAVGYYTATVKLPADCYNYVLDKVYTCQIVISQKSIAVQWTPNTDGTFEWTFNGLGKGPVATIINPYTGEVLNEAYTVDYAPVASNGTIGQYTTKQPVNAGKYVVRVTLNNADANYVLDEDSATQEFTIKKLDVEITWSGADGYDEDKGVYYWYYDGNEHDIDAKISLVGLAVNKDGVVIDSLGIERTDVRTKLVTVGSATATVVLLNDPFNANFNITNPTSQVYEVRKAVIDAVTWTDKLNQKFDSDDTPEYDFGSISGVNGPAFVASALNDTVTLVVTYNKTYTGDWVVDESVGYVAYAKLSAADAANYELADGAEYFEITFLIKSVGGFKTPIDVTWVVFINDYDYVLVSQFIDDGGFVYNGSVQHPTPIYIKDNGVDYEKLELQPNSIGADAGKYTARIKPSSVYSIDEDDFTYDYEIKKLDVAISWQNGQNDSDTSFSYIYSGVEQKPYAYVSGNYSFTIEVTVKGGKVNAGTYPATATVSKNFNITSGKTQVYTIEKKGLQGGLVEWDWNNASGDATNGYYWIYNGNDHAPTAKIPAQNWGGDYDLVLLVTGNTSEIGKHTAYAVLSSSVAEHNNFKLTDTVSVSFEIKQVQAGKVYWEDPADPDTAYEDGTADATKLVFTYNGNADGLTPKAFYYDADGNKVYLTVTVIGGTAVNAGTYTAYVSSELDFESELPTCTFKINPMEITVQWDGTATLTFNGSEQAPAVTLSNGADNYVLIEGVDYEVKGYTKAGNHTAEIKFLNTNYTCADTDKKFDFEIEKIELVKIDGTTTTEGFAWDTTNGYDAASDSYFWQYDGSEHYPELTISYAIDGVDVVFVIEYVGKASAVGTHKVTAYIKSATLNGVDVTENFTFEAEMEYVINTVSVTIEWDWTGASTGTDENGDTYYFWKYDTDKHAPKAYLLDANGNRIQKADGTGDLELTVYGGESNARDTAYTATAVVPSEYNFTGDNTQKYFVKKATIEVNWVFTDATGAELTAKTDDNGKTYYEWTYGTTVTAKAYIKNDDGTNGAELTSITGFETDAGTHTLTVSQSDGNYEFASQDGATQVFVINPQKVYVLWYGADGIDNNDTTNFEWTYGGENTVPTAYLAYKDVNGDLQLILDENGDAIKVEVSGASNEIGTHTAQVVDTFVNYEFETDATLKQPFKINEKDATGFGWTAEGATVSGNATDGFTYTYEYSGANNLPVPSSSVEDLEFNITIVKVNADNTTETVLAITEVGTYKVTVTSRDGNYKVPDALKEITVEVNAKTVKAEWDESELVYNGKNQMPKAYYTDVDGNKIELGVTVTGDTAAVSTTPYTATATLTSTNYKLDPTTTTYEFTITAKTISVTWGDTEFEYDGKAHATLPKVVLTSAEKDGITRIVYEIKDKDGNVVAGTDETDRKVIKAGEYTIKVWLEGSAAGNYKLDKEECTFNVTKKALTITAADDKEITYGNSLTLTLDDVKIEGLIAGEAADIKADLEKYLSQWLICHYTNTSLPDEYTIYVDASWLNDYLDNYTVTGVDGKLTVNPAEGKLIWKADKYDENSVPVFTYDGEANLPQAFYYDALGNKVHLNVKLATVDADGNYVVSGGDAKAVGDYYAVIVDANGNVIKGHGSYTFNNFGVKFVIEKREIVVTLNVDGYAEWKYGDVSSENVADLLGLDKGYFIGDTKPLDGDDLGIKLEIVETFENGFLNAGSYTIAIKWDENGFGSNYTVTVVVGKDTTKNVSTDAVILTTTLDKAEITVKDYDGIYAQDEEVYTVYDDNGILIGTDGYVSNFVTDTKDFLNIAGYQGANVKVQFSERFDADAAIPDAETYRFMGDPVEEVFAEGTYVYLFKIEIENHKTLFGKLIVEVKYDDYYLSLLIVKNKLTEQYGYEAPENLAVWLIENGYAEYDEVTNAAVSKETFLTWVTAKVVDEDGNEVSGRLMVGTYKVIFGLNENADEQYSIYKATSRTVTIEITKYVIGVDWGNAENLNYTYDGASHMPVIKVEGIVLDDSNKVADGVYEITINGEMVKVTVTVDGDFTTAGGHSVLVSVDDGNYTVEEELALRSVSITAPAIEVPGEPAPAEGNGLEDWKLALIIAAAIILGACIIALVVGLVKRRKMGDDDGFYDPVDESDL